MPFYIEKSSGDKELFDIKKFSRSLQRSGAPDTIIEQLAHEIEKNKHSFKTTQDIYSYALDRLKVMRRPLAARYNLKQALLNLGPSGFPFEEFVGHLFKEQGFTVEIGSTCKGWCIEHEVDVIAEKKNEHLLIECKFHNNFNIKSDVKVPLYVKARFDDLAQQWESNSQEGHKFHTGYVVTNTNFTSQAIQYASCAGIKLLSWSYPFSNNLARQIDSLGIHPVTALTSISNKQIAFLINNGFVLCKDVHKHINTLKQLNVTDEKLQEIINEADGVCKL